jgi:hypothetical protein
MTSHSDKQSLINPECKPRELMCQNPTHSEIRVVSSVTHEKCPICDNLMITVVKSVVKIDELVK